MDVSTLSWIVGDVESDNDDRCLSQARLEPPASVPLSSLLRWGHGHTAQPMGAQGQSCEHSDKCGGQTADDRRPPFLADSSLNEKVILWQGDLGALEVDALITPCAANYSTGTSTVFSRLLRYGGQDLREELEGLDVCRSGDARLVKAFGVPSRFLIVTVGPKFKEKYQIAAENTLNACYRECFKTLAESNLRHVAVPCSWYTKGYPIEDQVHVGLRTMRKCLEKLGHSIDSVVVVASTPQEHQLYEQLMPFYFPRDESEVVSGEGVPASCWTSWGEVTVEERKIRLTMAAEHTDSDGSRDGSPLFSPAVDVDRDFLDARDDADKSAVERLECTMSEASTVEVAKQVCMRYLRHARHLRPESDGNRFVYRGASTDFAGRRVLVLLGSRLPPRGVRDERALPLFSRELLALQGQNFVLVYANSDVASFETVTLEVLQEMLEVVSAVCRDTLQQLYIIHPGLWFRAAFMLARSWSESAARVWQSTIYCDSVAELSNYLSLEQLKLPPYVAACDGPGAGG